MIWSEGEYTNTHHCIFFTLDIGVRTGEAGRTSWIFIHAAQIAAITVSYVTLGPPKMELVPTPTLEYSETPFKSLRAVCPCLSWSAVAMRALIWVVFVPPASFTPTLRSGSCPLPTRQRAGHIACTKLPCLREIFKCAHLKFTVYDRK